VGWQGGGRKILNQKTFKGFQVKEIQSELMEIFKSSGIVICKLKMVEIYDASYFQTLMLRLLLGSL